jgi:hypothetical protein
VFHFHLVRNIKSALWLAAVALIPLSAIGLYWANKTGLPDEWREALEMEISKHGAHVEIGSLTYIPLRGFVAKNVRIFDKENTSHEISRLESIGLVLDNTRLARGEFRLRKIELKNARLLLPVDPKNPAGDSLDFTGVYGTIFMPDDRMIRMRDLRGTVGGIDVTVTADLLGRGSSGRGGDDEKNEGRRRELIANILTHLEKWDFGEDKAPSVRLRLSGDTTDKSTLQADFRFSAPSVERKGYQLHDLNIEGNLDGYLLTINDFSASDPRGTLTGHGDYQLIDHNGRFDVESSIDLPRLLKYWLATPINADLLTGGKQLVRAAGDFDISDISAPVVHMTGHARSESIMFRGISFDALDTWFSFQEGDLFLQDLKLERPDGTATAKAIVRGNMVRVQLTSTIPAKHYQPFFKGLPLEQVIEDFSENENPSIEISLDGSFDIKDIHSWQYTGSGWLKNMSYKGVPVKYAACSFELDHHKLDFFDGDVTFDYSDYAMREAFGGPTSGNVKVDRIRYNAGDEKTVTVENVVGDIWAAPLIRLFAPKIADDIEAYRFHRPPSLSGNGVVDVTPAKRTQLTINFSSPDPADYKFLGENITLTKPKGTVKVLGEKVEISDLSLGAFGGPVFAEFTHSGKSQLAGEISGSDLSLADISSTYGFGMKGAGEVTGRIEFTINDGDVATMDGKGLIGLENAELFSVPVFGPLSKVMSTVLNDERAGSERAKSAFCTFNIEDGILSTRDFRTATTSITFAGDGQVDLDKQEVDFTVRLNARGLLGLITLPLRPFSGLFQFRGTGPIKETVWENVRVTEPLEEQEEILLADPPKARIVPKALVVPE